MIGEALGAVGQFLLDHLDLLSEIANAIEGGTPKQAIIDAVRAAIREAKVAVSDEAMKEELGIK